jgi:hypothetical protein
MLISHPHAIRYVDVSGCKARSDEILRCFAGLYNGVPVACPSCGQRKGRRSCPALGAQICTICCGTKRLVEIRCPADCVYLASAREHPPAPALKQQQSDLTTITRALRDLSDAQVELFVALTTAILQHRASDLHRLLDADVVDAATAVAATLETAARGVIYEHRPSSLPAERLAIDLTATLQEPRKLGGSKLERDAALVLRRIAESAAGSGAAERGSRSYLELLQRTLKAPAPSEATAGSPEPRRPLIELA